LTPRQYWRQASDGIADGRKITMSYPNRGFCIRIARGAVSLSNQSELIREKQRVYKDQGPYDESV
jgi:hypothetical protein